MPVLFVLCLDMVHLHTNDMQELEIVFEFALCIQGELFLYCIGKQLPGFNLQSIE